LIFDKSVKKRDGGRMGIKCKCASFKMGRPYARMHILAHYSCTEFGSTLDITHKYSSPQECNQSRV